MNEFNRNQNEIRLPSLRGLVCKETVMLRRCGVDLSTELIM